MKWIDLDTPAVLIDLDVMERNLTRLAEYSKQKKLNLRPHTKTHKIPGLAEAQIAQGARGVTVAKIGEAEVMAAAGINDIMVAYPIVGEHKAERLAKLAQSTRISVSLDSESSAKDISRAAHKAGVNISILVEIDVGFRRCGIADENKVLELARKVSELPALEFKGLMFYPGHFLVVPEKQMEMLADVNAQLDRTYEVFERASVPIPVVSGGSTPTAYISHLFHGVNEIRPGMYLFNDRNMLGAEVTTVENCALSVLVTVVSDAVPRQVIVDGGTKTFSSDRYLAGDGKGFGMVKEDPAAMLVTMSEEHGQLDLSNSRRIYRIGEKLSVIPNHVCTTVNMHDVIYGIRGKQVVEQWEVKARGRVN